MLYLWVINFAPCYQSLGGIEPFCQWLQCIRDGVRWNVLRRQKIYGWLWRLHGCPNVHPMPWCAPKWTPRQRKRTKCSSHVSSQRYLWISCRLCSSCLCILLGINLATLKYLNLFARHTSQTGPQTKGFTKRAILPASGFEAKICGSMIPLQSFILNWSPPFAHLVQCSIMRRNYLQKLLQNF